jgi:hypothetical protein
VATGTALSTVSTSDVGGLCDGLGDDAPWTAGGTVLSMAEHGLVQAGKGRGHLVQGARLIWDGAHARDRSQHLLGDIVSLGTGGLPER